MKNLKFWFGLLISGFFLWLSLKDVQWAEVQASLRGVQYIYLAACLLILLTGHLVRALRWQYLLLHIKKIPVYDLFSIIMIANLLLSTLPARLGEFIRAYLLGTRHNISKTTSFSTIVVERTFDGCTALLLFVFALWMYPGSLHISLPGMPDFSLKKAIAGIFVIYLLVLLLLISLKTFPTQTHSFVQRITSYLPPILKQKILDLLNSFISGLDVFHNMRASCISLLLSGIVWTMIALSYYFVLLAFGIRSEWYMNFILSGFVVIAVMIPAAPGFVGTFHFALQICLQEFCGVSSATSISYSWVMWLCGMVINILPGLYYFNKFNLELGAIAREAQAKNA